MTSAEKNSLSGPISSNILSKEEFVHEELQAMVIVKVKFLFTGIRDDRKHNK